VGPMFVLGHKRTFRNAIVVPPESRHARHGLRHLFLHLESVANPSFIRFALGKVNSNTVRRGSFVSAITDRPTDRQAHSHIAGIRGGLEIALACFSDQSHCSRRFREHFGTTPSSYRWSLR